jgi:hypothetical protein
MKKTTFIENGNYPFTYGDSKANEEERLSNYIVNIISNNKNKIYLMICFMVLFGIGFQFGFRTGVKSKPDDLVSINDILVQIVGLPNEENGIPSTSPSYISFLYKVLQLIVFGLVFKNC